MGAEVHERIAARWGAEAVEVATSHGTLALLVAPARLAQVVRSLKEEFGFDLMLDVTAVDWPERVPRFDVVYHFYSTRDLVRVRVKTRVTVEAPVVDTLVPLYNSARFAERECHEK